MTHRRPVMTAGALALAVALLAPAPAAAQEASGPGDGEALPLDRLAAVVEERAEELARRIEERGERRAAEAADAGRSFLAESIEENAEQEADNVRRTGNHLATCITLEDPECEPHGPYWALIPEGYDERLFGEVAEMDEPAEEDAAAR